MFPPINFEPLRDDLQSKGFEIHAIACNSIEAKFVGEYLKVADMIRELDQEGWEWKEAGKAHINRNTQ